MGDMEVSLEEVYDGDAGNSINETQSVPSEPLHLITEDEPQPYNEANADMITMNTQANTLPENPGNQFLLFS